MSAAGPARPPHPRVLARTLAMQLLYAWEANRYVDDAELLPGPERSEAGDSALALARKLFAQVAAQRVPLDGHIDRRLTNWTIHRLAATDRAILRLAAWELLYDEGVPPKVAITEAIRLARDFGSDDKTPRLVNGVLDRIAREHRGLGQDKDAGKGPEPARGDAKPG